MALTVNPGSTASSVNPTSKEAGIVLVGKLDEAHHYLGLPAKVKSTPEETSVLDIDLAKSRTLCVGSTPRGVTKSSDKVTVHAIPTKVEDCDTPFEEWLTTQPKGWWNPTKPSRDGFAGWILRVEEPPEDDEAALARFLARGQAKPKGLTRQRRQALPSVRR